MKLGSIIWSETWKTEERHIWHGITYMQNLNQKKVRFIETEYISVYQGLEGGGIGKIWEKHKLSAINKIEDLINKTKIEDLM